MEFHTQQSLSGFIASDPQQSVTENGDTRFCVRVGQPHFRHEYGRISCSSSSSMSPVAAMPRHRSTLALNLVDIAKPWLLRRAQKALLHCRS